MEVGIVAEGISDFAVIRNILQSLKIDDACIHSLLPSVSGYDNTDLSSKIKQTGFSNWLLVKDFCQNETVSLFFELHEESLLIVQIDTAECSDLGYDVPRPDTNDPDFISKLLELITEKVNSWLPDNFHNKTVLAIAIEETEAWILTMEPFNKSDTDKIPCPKETMDHLVPRKIRQSDINRFFRSNNTFDKYDFLSKPMRRSKKLDAGAEQNYSLKAFIQQLKEKIDQQNN